MVVGGGPGAPVSVVPAVVVGDGSATLRWGPASGSGGVPVVRYEYSFWVMGDKDATVSSWLPVPGSDGSTTTHTVTGLTVGKRYGFEVRAVDADGVAGAALGFTGAGRVSSVPAAPAGFEAVAGDAQVTLSWSKVADRRDAAVEANGFSPVLRYESSRKTGGGDWSGWTIMVAASGFLDFTSGAYNAYDSHTVTGLTNGTVYGFRVRAVNANGAGPHSQATGVVASGVPGRARGLEATPSSGSVELSWQPGGDGGSPIVGWQYRLKGAAEGSTIPAFVDGDRWTAVPASSAATRGYVVVGLANEWVYRFQVRATNKNGAGTPATSADVNPGDVPGAPTALAGTPGKDSVTLSWTPPLDTSGELNDGGSPIVGYEYSQKAAGGQWGEWKAIPVTATSDGTTGASITAVDEQTYMVSGLTAGTAYGFRVRAANATGGGAYAQTTQDHYPGQRPAAPTNVVLTPAYDAESGEGRITITWAAGGDGGSPVTKWQYKLGKTTTALAGSTDWKTICDATVVPGCASMVSVTIPRPPGADGSLPDGVAFFEDNRDFYVVVRALNAFHRSDDDVNTGGLPSAVAHARIEAHVPRAPDGFIHAGYSADPKTAGAEAVFHVYRDRLDNADDSHPRLRDEYSFRTGDGPWSIWHRFDGDDNPVGWKPFHDVTKKLGVEYTIRYRHVNRLGAGASGELRFVWGAPPLPGAANPDSSNEPPYLSVEPGTSRATLKLQYKPSAGGALVAASTDDEGTYDDTVWEYSHRVGDAAWQPWTAIGVGEQFAGGSSDGYVVDGLDNGVAYGFRVRATNNTDNDAWYGQIIESRRPATPGVAPPAPLNLTAKGGDRSVELSWVSAGDGGPAITGWEYCETTTACDAEGDWKKVAAGHAATTTATVTKFAVAGVAADTVLVNGTSYTFRVRARNAIGAGAAAEALPVTPGRPPGAPVRALVEAGDGEATIRVAKPAQPGLGLNRVVAYEVRKKTTGGVYDAWETLGTTVAATADAATRPSAEAGAVVRNLVNGRTYTFQVRARNSYGPGPHVETSAVTPIGPPAPGTLVATAGDARVVLSWTAAGSAGSTIVGWEYRQRQGDGGYGPWANIADSTVATATHTVGDLSNGIAYRFEVRATTANPQIKGDPFASNPVTPSAVPPAPESVGATRGDGEVTLSWTPGTPGAPGEATWASETTGWQYRTRTDDTEFGAWTTIADSGATTTGHVVENLTNGVAYTFEVRATNTIGEGPTGTVSATPATVPSAPTVTATAADEMVTLVWASTGNGGSPITAWQHRTTSGQWTDVADPTTTTVPVPNLENGVAHTFEVRATNDVGPGATGTAEATPAGTPPAPELTATAGDSMVTLAWTPTGDGGSPITAWQVRTTGGAWVTMAADTTGMPIPNLENGVAYTFEVRATNTAGTGAVATESATPAKVPSAPEVTVTAGDGQITLAWTSTGDGGSAITAWQHRTRIGVGDWGEWTTMAADASTVTLTGLNSGTGTIAYTFAVRAQNTVGNGAITVSEEVTPTEASTVGDDYYSGTITGPSFCAGFSLGGARLFALDSNGDGTADTCSLPYTRREAIARQNAITNLANRHPDQYRKLVNAACATLEGDEPCGGDALAAPGYPPIDDGGPYYSGTITGPSYCANQSLGGPTTYPLDSDGDGVADTCSLPYSRREAIARQKAGDTLAATHPQQFDRELAEECRRLANANHGDNPADLANDACAALTRT